MRRRSVALRGGPSELTGRLVMADRDITIGRAINLAGMIGVMAGIVLFASAIVMLLFRRGFGFDLSSAFRWFW
jgi:hypothetical protein